MTYEKTEWQNGDIITAEKLNNMEDGIANAGVLVVRLSISTNTLNKTWQEIYDAPFCIISTVTTTHKEIATVIAVGREGSAYVVLAGNKTFVADSADGYPTVYNQG